MKVIFLGTPDFAIPSLEELLQTSWIEVLAVCTQTDKEAGRGQNIKEPPVKQLAKQKGILVLQSQKISKETEIIKIFKELKPDLFVGCAFGEFLNEEILNIAPLGVINVHPSLLPKYRGAAPINWAILNSEKETGVTIMKTELSMDAGPIILQEKCEIEENETSIDLSKKLSVLSAKALIKALGLIKDGKAKYIPQDDNLVTKAPKLEKSIGLIDWNKSTKEINNKIRGLQPWPSAFTHYNGRLIKIWDSRGVPWNALRTAGKNITPGTIVEIADYTKVKTGDGFINIYKMQEENKKIINAKDWINGARAKIGDKFE